MELLLTLAAIAAAVGGIIWLVRGAILPGVALIAVAVLLLALG